LQIGLLSQWYEPEPATIPPVLARELTRRGHSVRVLTGFPNYPEGRIYEGYRMTWRLDSVASGVPVRRVALFPSHGQSHIGRLANYGSFAISASLFGAAWFKNIEGLWVYNSPPTVGLPTWLIKSRYRPRVLLHIMDLWPESLLASGFGSGVLKWPVFQQGLEKWLSMTYNSADSIACTTHTQIELLADKGVPRHKLAYIPLWADETLFYPMQRDEALAATLGLTDKTVLLYAGAIGEPQGLDTLIEVCGNLKNEPRFHCVLAGWGTAEPRLRQQAKEKGLRNITFLGRWPIRDMTRLMSIGDVHLVSLRSDPLAEVAMPSKVPATLACAKPVIVAALGDAARAIVRSGAGWTCHPGDSNQLEAAIRTALDVSPSVLQMMGQRGRETYETEFAVNVGAGRVEELLAGRTVAT
jgi:glycosyltransferase involved in cell wall biosynthesis